MKVPPGEHTILFRYVPISFYAGLVLTVIGFITLVLSLFVKTKMKKVIAHSRRTLCLVTGGYLGPDLGITLFFLSTVLLFLTVGPDIQLGKDELLSLLFACCGAASALYAGDKWGAILFSGSFMAGSFFYVTLRNSSDWELPLLKTIVIGGCIVGFCEAFRQISLVPYGLFYNPNPFSGFLTPLVPVSLYLYSKYRKDDLCGRVDACSCLPISYPRHGQASLQ